MLRIVQQSDGGKLSALDRKTVSLMGFRRQELGDLSPRRRKRPLVILQRDRNLTAKYRPHQLEEFTVLVNARREAMLKVTECHIPGVRVHGARNVDDSLP
jgi:hypothetical protein